jgi:hypothetical protein
MATINTASKLAAKLAKIVQSTEGHPRVSVGFLRDASYPDGTPVALVASVQEFGSPANNIPPRPFFRLMVAEKSGGWPEAVRLNLKATDYDAHKTLDRVGQGIAGQLKDSIKTLTDPPLAPSTIKRKGFDTVLIDTGHMLNSVDYRVED